MKSSKTCVFTIASKNYQHFARTLFSSAKTFAPDMDRVLALCDRPDGEKLFPEADKMIGLEELPIPEIDKFTFQYTLLEINTAIKPFVFEQLFTKHGYDKVIYFDPDIRLFHSIDEMNTLLDKHDVLLTPHITEPLDDDKRPSEIEILQCGTYNLGFVALRRSPQTEKLLRWWQTKMLRDCIVDFPNGLFVDQKWMELAPSLVDRVFVQRNPGWNVAYWNLKHRCVEKNEHRFTVNGQPLVFYHFSGFDPEKSVFSKHQNRFTLDNLPPAVADLAELYSSELRQHGYPQCKTRPYAFARFPDGTPIPDAARKIYRKNRDRLADRFQNMLGDGAAAFMHYLNEPADVGGKSSKYVTRLAHEVYLSRPDLGLPDQFPDITGVHAMSYAQWFMESAPKESNIPSYFVEPVQKALYGEDQPARARPAPNSLAKQFYKFAWRFKNLTHFFLPLETRQRIHAWLFRSAFVKSAPAPKSIRSTELSQIKANYPFGMNIVGYLHAELGVGEAARCTIRASQAANIPVALIDYRKGTVSRMGEEIVTDRPRKQIYGINVLHVNADQVPFAIAEFDESFFKNHYNIGVWNWELPELPDQWTNSFNFLNEVWAPSAFCHDAISQKSPIPVTHIPYCIDFSVPENITRQDLGLPTDSFLFLFMFDAFSIPQRKNPFAVIDAYLRARSSFKRKTNLVLKIINADENADFMRLLREKTRNDDSIVFLNSYLKRAELSALFNLSDCYVSLHRSEGFGLTLAESMYLGKPVIATGWSSNMDFMTPWNSFPVKYKLVELEDNYGPYNKGQFWADPDIDHAAECMIQVANDETLARAIGQEAKKHIRTHFSPAAVGQLIKKRLDALQRMDHS